MRKNRKGFTLAELLIVVAIIGVLVSISIPIFNASKEKAILAVNQDYIRSAESVAAADWVTFVNDYKWGYGAEYFYDTQAARMMDFNTFPWQMKYLDPGGPQGWQNESTARWFTKDTLDGMTAQDYSNGSGVAYKMQSAMQNYQMMCRFRGIKPLPDEYGAVNGLYRYVYVVIGNNGVIWTYPYYDEATNKIVNYLN